MRNNPTEIMFKCPGSVRAWACSYRRHPSVRPQAVVESLVHHRRENWIDSTGNKGIMQIGFKNCTKTMTRILKWFFKTFLIKVPDFMFLLKLICGVLWCCVLTIPTMWPQKFSLILHKSKMKNLTKISPGHA